MDQQIPDEVIKMAEEAWLADGGWGELITYLEGYIACCTRFGGGECNKPHKEPWEGAVDTASGAFTQWEIDNIEARR